MHAVLIGTRYLQSSLELLEQNPPSFHGCKVTCDRSQSHKRAHESDLVLPSGALGLTPEWAMGRVSAPHISYHLYYPSGR